MAYSDHFILADDLITHLDSVVGNIQDPFIQSRYIGFVAVSATTVYELAIREIFVEFANKKHKVFGEYAGSHFKKLNGRIKTRDLRRTHVPRFGQKYVRRYERHVQNAEAQNLRANGVSILSSYNNLIEWRNQFAHQGAIPTTPTYAETIKAYEHGKEIVHCLARVMQR